MKVDQRINHTLLDLLLLLTLLLSVAQVAILALPEFNYRVTESAITDLLFCVLSFAVLQKTSYRKVIEKSLWAAIFVNFLFSAICNLLIQFAFYDLAISVLITTALAIIGLLAFSFRFLLRWDAYRDGARAGNIYLVIGRPESPLQLLVALYTGLGGSFGITDSEKYYWHYSGAQGALVREEYKLHMFYGKMLIRIGKHKPEYTDELNTMVGRVFGLFHNCLEILTLSKKWGMK